MIFVVFQRNVNQSSLCPVQCGPCLQLSSGLFVVCWLSASQLCPLTTFLSCPGVRLPQPAAAQRSAHCIIPTHSRLSRLQTRSYFWKKQQTRLAGKRNVPVVHGPAGTQLQTKCLTLSHKLAYTQHSGYSGPSAVMGGSGRRQPGSCLRRRSQQRREALTSYPQLAQPL